MRTELSTVGNGVRQPQAAGGFFDKLTAAAANDLASLAFPHTYQANCTLFSEKDPAPGVFVVMEGEVKLSISSSDGRRLSLRIAKKGDVLGLASALSGTPCEMTAETLRPSKIAPIRPSVFLSFLGRHPEAYRAVTKELSRQYGMACEQLRTVGLSASAPEKLARLLLDWSETGQTTERGTRFHLSMTHEEVGEFIGASRETVTRTLSVFKTRRLVALHGATLTIPSRTALEAYAGC